MARTPKKSLPVNEVSPEDVVNYLKASGTAPKQLLEKDDAVVNPTSFFGKKDILKKSELKEEEINKLSGKSEAEAETKKSDTPKPTDFEPEVPTIHQSIEMETSLPSLGSIVLTDYEKDLYVKTLLNDAPFSLDIEPFKGVTINVKSRTLRTENLVFHILSAERESGKIIGPETYFTRLQQLLAAVQITQIGDKNVSIDPSVLGVPRDAAHPVIEAHIDAHYMDITPQKWNAINFAIRIFETKLKLCNDNLRDENFWLTEDIS
jgi:hypothetical protein